MATLQDRVEGYIGTVTDTSSLDGWLVDALHRIVDLLSGDKLNTYSANVIDAGSGISVQNYRIVRAHKSGYNADVIEAGLKAQVIDSASIYYATLTNPMYYIENGTAFVLPNGGTIIAVPYSPIDHTTIAGSTQFLKDFEEHIVLYAAMQFMFQNISTALATVGIYIDTDEDFELAQVKSNAQTVPLISLYQQLKSQYDFLIKTL